MHRQRFRGGLRAAMAIGFAGILLATEPFAATTIGSTTSSATTCTVETSPVGTSIGETSIGETKIRLATLAPKDTSFYRILQGLGEKWRDAPDGGIKLIIHADAGMGGEGDIVKKMRVGQLQAAMLTVSGLEDIDKSVTALQNLPMMFRSLDECAFAREKLQPIIARRMEEQGFVLLFLGDVGWVKFFSVKPMLHPDDLKKVKLFTWVGDNPAIDLMKNLGLKPVPLEPTDVLIGLQTGLVDAVPMVPFFAQISQIHDKATHMLDLDWAPLVGGGVILKKTWDALTHGQRDVMRATAKQAGIDIIARNRLENDESIEAMKKRGLVVHPATPEIQAEWRAFVEPVYPRLRGLEVPADLYDAVVAALKEYRAPHEASK